MESLGKLENFLILFGAPCGLSTLVYLQERLVTLTKHGCFCTPCLPQNFRGDIKACSWIKFFIPYI
jgi:hypothetical protein